MKKELCWTVVTMVLALTLAACGQTGVPPIEVSPSALPTTLPPPAESPTPTLPVMLWHGDPPIDAPRSFEEVVARAELVVLAEVVSVEQGPDYVGNPEVNDRAPTQRVTIWAVKVYKGAVAPGETLILFQHGVGVREVEAEAPYQALMINENDPPYQPGQRYLLGLERVVLPEEVKQWQPEPWQEGMVITLPNGRLLVNPDDTVTGVMADAAGRSVPKGTGGQTLEEIETLIAAAIRAGHPTPAPTPTEAPTPTAPLTTLPVVKPVTIDRLPPIPRDLLFLDQGNLVRWKHTTSRFETLSGNATCYWVSADRRTVVLESAKGGDVYEIALLDLASGRKTSLVETTSPVTDLAISPDGQWVTYIQSETLPDEWHCRPDLVAFPTYPFSSGGPFPGAIYSLRLSEYFYSQTGIVWSPDGQAAIFQDWGEHPMLLYVPTDGSAVYDLSRVIQGCCFTWLR